MSNVIQLFKNRAPATLMSQDRVTVDELKYKTKIGLMSKVDLLEEMVNFQEERKEEGKLTPSLMMRGKHLFKALEECADTQEMRILARSYCRHLDYELAALKDQAE